MINLLENTAENITLGEGALYAIFAIAMVFVILLIIIGITSLSFKLLGLFELKKEIDSFKKEQVQVPTIKNENKEVNIEDDDMMAAVLVATIDYQQEIKKDVRVTSVKRIK